MLIVTEGAKQELMRILASTDSDDPEDSVRLVTTENQELNLMLDKEHEGDLVVEPWV